MTVDDNQYPGLFNLAGHKCPLAPSPAALILMVAINHNSAIDRNRQ